MADIRSTPIGIDLGTTYSSVAYLDTEGRPNTIANILGDMLTPSAILVAEGSVIVGKEAVKSSTINPGNYAECFKRDMGSDQFRKPVNGVNVPPEVLSAFVLESLKRNAESKLNRSVQDVVITVPAFFDEARRKATQDAGRLAGLNVLDIINEPTAAAVAYGYQVSRDETQKGYSDGQTIMVYDLGGGTFDVTLLRVHADRLETLATDGDVRLGGKDFDERIINFIAERVYEEGGVDPRHDQLDMAQLMLDAQDLKHSLSVRNKTTMVGFYSGKRTQVEMSRDIFELLSQDLLERTETTALQLLEQANLPWSEIDKILLVGGSSRMPMVVDMLTRLTGKIPSQVLSADEAVSHGAALYCADVIGIKTGQSLPKKKLINVNSHSLGVVGLNVKTKMRANSILIPRNTQLPCHVKKVFLTAKDGQKSVVVPVVEGESSRPEQCIALGQCIVNDLPYGLPAGSKVEVQYRYKPNGRITVSAQLLDSNHSASVEIERKRGLKLEDLPYWRKKLCQAT